MPLPPSKFKCSILPKFFFYVLSTPPGNFLYFLFPPPTPFPSPSSFYIPTHQCPFTSSLYSPPYPHLSPFYLIFIFPPPPPTPPPKGGGVVGGGNINKSKGTIWFWVLGFRHRIGIRGLGFFAGFRIRVRVWSLGLKGLSLP